MKQGEDVLISPAAIFRYPELVEIGNHVAIDQVYISTKLKVGNHVHISSGLVTVGGRTAEIQLDDYCFVSANSTLVAGSEDFVSGKMIGAMAPVDFRDIIIKPIRFEKHSGCGAGSVILPGVTLAVGSVVGAGAVVTESTEPWGVYAGSPAKLIKHRPSEYIRNLEEKGLI